MAEVRLVLEGVGLDDHSAERVTEERDLPQVQGSAELYAYEILNFVDGHRSLADIRDAVSAEMGPIPLEVVADYLSACAEAKILEFR